MSGDPIDVIINSHLLSRRSFGEIFNVILCLGLKILGGNHFQLFTDQSVKYTLVTWSALIGYLTLWLLLGISWYKYRTYCIPTSSVMNDPSVKYTIVTWLALVVCQTVWFSIRMILHKYRTYWMPTYSEIRKVIDLFSGL